MNGREFDGERLRAVRDMRLLSQEELAELSGVNEIHISRLERGETKHPYPRTIRRLARALEVDPDELLVKDENGPLVLRPYEGTFAARAFGSSADSSATSRIAV